MTIAAGFATVLLLGIVMTAWQAIRATNAEGDTARQRDEAVDAQQAAAAERDNVTNANQSLRRLAAEQRRTLYATSMNLAQAAWETSIPGRTFELLHQQVPKPGEDDLRGFEWHYWNRFGHQDLKTVRLVGFDQACYSGGGARLSPDGTRVAAFTAESHGGDRRTSSRGSP
jgi:hypothetical protein